MLLQENGNGHVWGVPALWFPEGDQTRIAKAGNHPGFLHIGDSQPSDQEGEAKTGRTRIWDPGSSCR